MNGNRRIFFIVTLLSLLLAGCGSASTKIEKIQPFKLEPIEGSDLKRVVLTEKAAKRLAIQVAMVGDEQVGHNQISQGVVIASPELKTVISAPASGTILAPLDAVIPITGSEVTAGQAVFRLAPLALLSGTSTDQSILNIQVPANTVLLRMLVSPGQVVEAGQPLFAVADTSKVWVRVPLTEDEFARVDHSQRANILLLQGDDDEQGLEADAIENVDDVEDGTEENGDADYALYYGVDNGNHSLTLGQHVQVRLALTGSGKPQKVIPYAAVIYDTKGDTWVYTNPEPLVFERHPVVIDYIEGDRAVLLEGLESGTAVVVIGGPELLGAETGVSK